MEKIHASKLLAGLVPAGFLTSDPEVELVTTDSREVRPGCIFVAFPGERFDGHDFAAKALEEGAAFVVVNHPVEGVPAEKAILFPHSFSTPRTRSCIQSSFAMSCACKPRNSLGMSYASSPLKHGISVFRLSTFIMPRKRLHSFFTQTAS